MIPIDKPIIGAHLEEVRLQRGYSIMDALFVFGLSSVKWSAIARGAGKEKPVKPSLALLVRVLDAFPEIEFLPKMPTTEEIDQLLRSLDKEINNRKLAILAGKEATGGYRWLTLGKRQVPVNDRLFLCLKMMLEGKTDPAGNSESTREGGSGRAEEQRKIAAERLTQYKKIVQAEGAARGSADVFKSGSWTADQDRKPRRTSKPKTP